MALYIPHSIFHLARLLYVRPETFGPYYVAFLSSPSTALNVCSQYMSKAREESFVKGTVTFQIQFFAFHGTRSRTTVFVSSINDPCPEPDEPTPHFLSMFIEVPFQSFFLH